MHFPSLCPDLGCADNLDTDGWIAETELLSHAALQVVCDVYHIGTAVQLLDLIHTK